ncbi:DUF3040 domain-containing protein [Nonomuraea sp. NPDC048916]|uniref:DUF3040 domain-containing protein n=1 Tax=Nonomuraea sp. NPDC048916 TaxID=3154232 RepID=UPI0033DC8636
MLNDREREALREIQEHLSAEDPDLVRTFERPPRDSHWIVYTVAMVLSVVLSLLMLASGSLIGGLVFATGAVLAWLGRSQRFGADDRQN